jgi:hypothetical protein
MLAASHRVVADSYGWSFPSIMRSSLFIFDLDPYEQLDSAIELAISKYR